MSLASNILLASLAASGPFSEHAQDVYDLPGWQALILLIVLITIVVIALTWNARRYTPPHIAHEQVEVDEHDPERVAALSLPADDLTRIEGIGPKIAQVLQHAGIESFAQLAETDPARLQELLTQERLRLADPTTWPEQARLAASGDWDAFDRLTSHLKAGRRA